MEFTNGPNKGEAHLLNQEVLPPFGLSPKEGVMMGDNYHGLDENSTVSKMRYGLEVADLRKRESHDVEYESVTHKLKQASEETCEPNIEECEEANGVA